MPWRFIKLFKFDTYYFKYWSEIFGHFIYITPAKYSVSFVKFPFNGSKMKSFESADQ